MARYAAPDLPLSPRGFLQPRFSPDGRRLAFTVGSGTVGGDGDVWVYSLDSQALSRLTFGENSNCPTWTPDGREITYFDLKPANVKLTPEGRVKVLDFGLAKAWAGEAPEGGSSSAALSQSPTLAHTGTVAGVILGTAAYMSPEQARGKPVDKRADVWSFGVLLWEILTGHTLFAGDTVTDVIAAVVTKEPDLDALPKTTPRAVRRLLSSCLRKDPRTRLPDMGAARLELQDVVAGTATEPEPVAPGVDAGLSREIRRLGRQRWAWAAAFVGAAGLAAVATVLYFTKAPPPQRAAHFVLDLPDGLVPPDWGPPVVSPDGSQVVFAASESGGQAMLWTRALDAPGVRALAGTGGAYFPFWSPDGGSIAFFAGGELRKLSLATGTMQRIGSLPEPGGVGGTWGEDGTILFSAGGGGARIYTVSAAGGEVRPLTTHDSSRGETGHWQPQLLPDGRRFLFLVGGGDSSGLYLASLGRPDERQLIRPGIARSLHVPPGRLLFVRDGTLLAEPFDAARGELSGDPVTVTQPVAVWAQAPQIDWGWFSASPSGTLTCLEGQASASFALTWLDRKGAQLGIVGKPGAYGQIALSPDERQVVVELSEAGGTDLWTVDLARGVATRLTFDPAPDFDPVWSPDGREVAFGTNREGGTRIYRKALQGNAPESPHGEYSGNVYPEYWSAHAKAILYVQDSQTFGMVSLDGDAKPEEILKKDFPIDEPQISPDGRWLAYISQESGQWEVYLEPFREDGERVRVSTEGGGQPEWRGDGRELFYVSPDGRLMAVDVQTNDGQVEVGLPVGLFPGVIADPIRDHYAVTADGQRFLVPVPVGNNTGTRLHVVTNWTSLLN